MHRGGFPISSAEAQSVRAARLGRDGSAAPACARLNEMRAAPPAAPHAAASPAVSTQLSATGSGELASAAHNAGSSRSGSQPARRLSSATQHCRSLAR
jgi:hypothetical protein